MTGRRSIGAAVLVIGLALLHVRAAALRPGTIQVTSATLSGCLLRAPVLSTRGAGRNDSMPTFGLRNYAGEPNAVRWVLKRDRTGEEIFLETSEAVSEFTGHRVQLRGHLAFPNGRKVLSVEAVKQLSQTCSAE